ncbi:TetR/AcrR family transcriptional regulator [Brevibacterium celere]|uniref:TetR/AcrR family transcriptional regulator n=1 Tax=Brevibacterium celere TaxID=225845 RepID=UPI0031D25833
MTQATPKGRPLDPELTDRVLAAVRAEVAEHGFMNLRIESIATTVGCGKTAIYRRWPTKPELVAAAILDTLELGEMPDTGDVVDDLVAHAWQNIENFRRSLGVRTHGNGLLLAMFNMDVIPLISADFMEERHARGRAILARAVDRGQMSAALDHDLILDALAGLTLFTMTLRTESPPPDDAALTDRYRTLARSLVGAEH